MGSRLWHTWADEMELLPPTLFLGVPPGPSPSGQGLPSLQGTVLGSRKLVLLSVRLGASRPGKAGDEWG